MDGEIRTVSIRNRQLTVHMSPTIIISENYYVRKRVKGEVMSLLLLLG